MYPKYRETLLSQKALKKMTLQKCRASVGSSTEASLANVPHYSPNVSELSYGSCYNVTMSQKYLYKENGFFERSTLNNLHA